MVKFTDIKIKDRYIYAVEEDMPTHIVCKIKLSI